MLLNDNMERLYFFAMATLFTLMTLLSAGFNSKSDSTHYLSLSRVPASVSAHSCGGALDSSILEWLKEIGPHEGKPYDHIYPVEEASV